MLGFTKINSKMKFHKLKDSYSGDRFQYSSEGDHTNFFCSASSIKQQVSKWEA